jgi:hypothetical protein
VHVQFSSLHAPKQEARHVKPQVAPLRDYRERPSGREPEAAAAV